MNGKELIVDLKGCKSDFNDINLYLTFINHLCFANGMKKKGDALVEYFPDNDFNRERDIVGYSICQIISLSNITIHLNEISKSVYINFFTCGEINENETFKLIDSYFKPDQYKKIILIRNCEKSNWT